MTRKPSVLHLFFSIMLASKCSEKMQCETTSNTFKESLFFMSCIGQSFQTICLCFHCIFLFLYWRHSCGKLALIQPKITPTITQSDSNFILVCFLLIPRKIKYYFTSFYCQQRICLYWTRRSRSSRNNTAAILLTIVQLSEKQYFLSELALGNMEQGWGL